MDIKRMHNMIEKLAECAEKQFESGIENVDTKEMSEVTDMMKDLSMAMYYRTLTKAMEEADTDEIMDMFDQYGDGRRFYDDYRYMRTGRYAPKGKGSYVGRKGYEEPPYYHMTPEMYREHDPEYYRDLDRSKGRMYYTEMGNNKDMSARDVREGKSWAGRRSYMETKELHRANTPEDKQKKMRDLEEYAKELTEDIVEMVADMSAEEKNLLRAKMQTLTQKIQ